MFHIQFTTSILTVHHRFTRPASPPVARADLSYQAPSSEFASSPLALSLVPSHAPPDRGRSHRRPLPPDSINTKMITLRKMQVTPKPDHPTLIWIKKSRKCSLNAWTS